MIWHSAETKDVISFLSSDENTGLDSEKALQLYKENIHELSKSKPSFIKAFLSKFSGYMTIIALIAIAISIVISIIGNTASWIFAVTAAVIILLDGVFDAYQEYFAKKIKYDLKNSFSYPVNVLRDSSEQTVNSDELLPGDIIFLKEGDLIPADARILQAVNLRCDEYILTGETVDAEKDELTVPEDIAPIPDRKNMLFEGCTVTHGTAKAIVTDIGKNTELSKQKKINKETSNTENAYSSTVKSIHKYSLILSIIAAFVSFILVIIFNIGSQIGFANLVADSLIDNIAIIIAIVPETLPASIGIILWLAIKNQNSLGNRLTKTSSLEKIAGISVICADKTGVLTPDSMTVSKIYSGNDICDLSEKSPESADTAVLKMALICGNGIDYSDSAFEAERDSGDIAIEQFCIKNENLTLPESLNIYPMETYVPFENSHKLITSVNMIGGKHYVISKGAPEELIKLCTNINHEEMLKIAEGFAAEGLRVIAVASKIIGDVPALPNASELENNLNFLGLIGLSDIPDSQTIRTLEECKKLGIRTVMITGDNIITAKAIARRLGILPDEMKAISGAEIEAMSDDELAAVINDYSVFARVSPEDKYRIVKALKRNRETVAVTGFKNSDAPVLRKADVGFAKSNSASDVAYKAANVVTENIALDNILSIIKYALNIYYNVKKTIHYFISSNLGELLALLLGAVLFGKNIFIAAQLLLINFLTDIIPSVSMGLSTGGDRSASNRLNEHKKLFSAASLITIAIQAISICSATLLGYSYGNSVSPATGQAVAFLIIGLSQILHIIPNFSDKLIIQNKISNYFSILISAAISIIVLLICSLTPINTYFGLTALTGEQVGYSITLSLMVVLTDILIKIGFMIYRKFAK